MTSRPGYKETVLKWTEAAVGVDAQYVYRVGTVEYYGTLSAGATYTSATISHDWMTRICIVYTCDQDTTYEVQESVNGSDWITTETGSVSAGGSAVIDMRIRLGYVRIRVTNTGAADGTLLLQYSKMVV